MLNITQVPAPRVDFIDPRSGFMSREWYRFFLNLFQLTGNGSNTASLTDLQVGPPTQETIIELDRKLESLYVSPSPETSELSAQINEVRQELKTLMLSFDSLELDKQIQGLSVTPPASQGEVVAVTATSPLASSGGIAPNLTIAKSDATTDGYLSSVDWVTFNNKQPAGSYVVVNGALGTPSSGTLTNCTGLPYSGLTGTVPTWNQNTTGSAATLTTTRTIGGSNFNGSANVTSFPSPGAIGATTPSTGAFTTLSTTSVLTVTGDNNVTSIGGTQQSIVKAGDTNNDYAIRGFQTSAGGTIAVLAAKATTTGAYPSSVGELHIGVQNGGSTLDVATFSSTGLAVTGSSLSSGATGYKSGAGGSVTQATSRTTGVTLDKVCGAITLFAAIGSITATTFTVTNSTVAATDTINVSVKSGTNVYLTFVTAVAAGSFNITFYTTGGIASDSPVFNFAVLKAVAA